MPEVIRSGKVKRPWTIALKCRACECVAQYTGADAKSNDHRAPMLMVSCPECGHIMALCDVQCFWCKGKGYSMVATSPGYGEREEGVKKICQCSDMGGKPKGLTR